MSTPPRIVESLERALALIDEHKLDEASELIEKAKTRAPDAPETLFALGTLASARGDIDEAIARFLDAADADPEWPSPLLAAGWEELERDDAERSLQIAEEVLEAWPNDVEARTDAMLMRAEAHLDLDDLAAARVAIEAIDIAKAEADTLFDVALLWCAVGEHGREEGVLRGLCEQAPGDPDALHALGGCLHERERHDEATELWLKVREIDLAAERSPLSLSNEELEGLAERTLRELPEEVRERLGNVPILIEDAPAEHLVKEGLDPRTLGLFTGTPLPEKSSMGGQAHSPDSAILYVRNLELACGSREELEEQIRITILHETAHFFGLDDDDLDAIGLG